MECIGWNISPTNYYYLQITNLMTPISEFGIRLELEIYPTSAKKQFGSELCYLS